MILINQQMELKMKLNKEQLDYLIGVTLTERRYLETAKREVTRKLNKHAGLENPNETLADLYKREFDAVSEELNFVNDLYDNLRNQDQELSYKTIQGGK